MADAKLDHEFSSRPPAVRGKMEGLDLMQTVISA